jgi:hypothetical protein
MLFGLVRNMVILTSIQNELQNEYSIVPPICPGRQKGIIVCSNQGMLPYRG